MPAKRPIELTESERTTITNGLRVAAEQFLKDAQVCRESVGMHMQVRKQLSDQFETQAKQSLELAERIDNASRVLIEPEPVQPVYACQNCEWTGAEDELMRPIQNLEYRVEVGEPMPAGECPACGALCHERKD